MTKKEFASILAYMVSATQRPITKNTGLVYFDGLNDLPLESLLFAVRRCFQLTRYKSLPSIGEIRERAIEHVLGPFANLSWSEEWGKVRWAVKTFGRTRGKEAKVHLTEVTRKVIDDLGWLYFCDSSEADLSFRMNQFRNAFENTLQTIKEIRLLANYGSNNLTSKSTGFSLSINLNEIFLENTSVNE